MRTEYIQVDRDQPDMQALARAALILQQGGLVAFPTETVYGLGANGLDTRAVRAIYAAKGRPSDNPLILHIADMAGVDKLVAGVTPNARILMEKYWPGPLTVILPRTRAVPDAVTGGLDTVAIRMPQPVVARELIRLAGVPVAGPSANTSGRPSPTSAADVLADLDGRIDAVVDAGPCVIGVESTVVDCTTPVPVILRPGGITYEMLVETLGAVEIDKAIGKVPAGVPRAPGMKYTHYAPAAPMTLVEGLPPGRAAAVICEQVEAALAQGEKVGAVVSQETAELLPDGVVTAVYGPRGDAAVMAAGLYTALRRFDHERVDVIYGEGIAETGIGLAVMNRMRKAAGYRIIKGS